MKKICRNCKSHIAKGYDRFAPVEHGDCLNKKFMAENLLEIDGLRYWDYEGYSAGFDVGAEFCCIHWENKIRKNTGKENGQ